MSDISEFYDNFSNAQLKTGINRRHISIFKFLKRFGLSERHRVLEIGCGIGTQTDLVASYVVNGYISAHDISPKSIDLARKRVTASNVEFFVTDVTKDKLEGNYDVILLPDVIEHIPTDLHEAVFDNISSTLNEDGFMLIHIPNPYYLEWLRIHNPKVLQIVDQPIYTYQLLPKVYRAGFYLHYLETYSLWIDRCDYQVLVFKKGAL